MSRGGHRLCWSSLASAPFADVVRSAILVVATACSLALLGWSLWHYEALPAYVGSNALPMGARKRLLSLLVASVIVGLAAFWSVGVRARAQAAGAVSCFASRMAPLALAGFLPPLFCWRAWVSRELDFGLLVAGYGFLTYLAWRRALDAGVLEVRLLRWLRASPGVRVFEGRASLYFVLAGAIAYAAFFSRHTINYHRSMLTLSWDLGLEDNLIWNLLHGGPFMKSSPLAGPTDSSHFGYHATLFAFVIAPFYALWPRAEMLLVIQAVLIAAAAIPLYLLAARRLGRAAACLIAFAYLLYPAVHGANLYDFHYVPIGIVFLWSALYCIEAHRYAIAIPFALLTLSIREDMAFDLAIASGFIALCTPHVRAGLVLGAISSVYFLLMKMVVMPRFLHGGESFIWQWRGLAPAENLSFSGVLMTLFGNPLFALRALFVPQKLLYVIQLGAPLAFLPWRRAIGFYLMIPGLLFTLLTVDAPPLIQISFQYTAHWVGFLFLALVVNLESLGAEPAQASRRQAALMTLVLVTLIGSYQYGAVLQQNTVRGGFAQYKFGWTSEDESRYSDLRALIDQVPADAKIAATEYLVSHVSNRADAYTLRLGLYDAEYVLFQINPGYEKDTTLPRSFSRKERDQARRALQTDFGVVEQRGPFVLARRGHPTDENASVLAQLQY